MSDDPQMPSGGLTGRGYELLVRAVVDYALYMIDPQGRIVTWNTGAERIKGYRAEEVIGRSLEMFFPQEDRLQGKPQQLIATAVRDGHVQDEGWRIRKDGSRFWALAVLDAVHDDAGNLIGLAKITRDMTERHEAQQHLDEVRAQLFQAQKMEALGQLTGGMAHDFNNLLTVIIGSSDLARRSKDPERIQLLLENIHEAGLRGRELTQNLLTFARRRAPQAQLLDLITSLKATSALLDQALPESISLDLEIGPDPFPVRVDANQLTDPEKMKQFQDAQNQLSGALGRLIAISENYPDLKSNQNFLALQSQLEGTENRIAVARRDYIEAVRAYNTEIRTFPGQIWAMIRGSKPMAEFTATDDAQRPPQVKFGK